MKSGDRTVVDDIGRRYGQELRLFCERMVFSAPLAEDMVQDVLMTCCRAEAGKIPTGSLRGWLYRVARNRCIDELRRMHPNVRLSAVQSADRTFAPAVVPIDPATTPAGRSIKEDRARRVQAAIDAMEDDLRDVVILHFYQGLSGSEMAEVLDLSPSGAKARLSRAAKILRERLAALDDSGA